MAECDEVAKSEELRRVLDDNDLMSWIVCGIEGFSKLYVDSAGEGGYDECIKHLDPKRSLFALIEVIGIENKSAVVSKRPKFVFIAWIGSETPIIERAKVSTISASVRAFFGRAHIGLQVNTLEEMSKDKIIKELNRSSGSHTPDEYVFDFTKEDIDFIQHDEEIDANENVTFDDLWEEFKKQNSKYNWILMQLAKDESLSVFGYGNGGIDELVTKLNDNEVVYGIFKVTAYNQAGTCTSIRERFVFMTWVPNGASVFARGRVATHKQVLLSKLQTYHADIRYESKDEISKEEIVKILDRSCGSHKPQKYIFAEGDEIDMQNE